MVELRHLRYFAAAAETGSISRAAQLLDTTQPSLTRQIHALERDVGATLLHRSSQGVRVTRTGKALLEHYQRIAAQIERVPEVVEAAGSGFERVRVGLPPGLPSAWFHKVIDLAGKSSAHVRLDLSDRDSPDQERALYQSQLDLAFMHHAPRAFRSIKVLSQFIGVAVRRPGGRYPDAHGLAQLNGARILAHTSWEEMGQKAELRAAAAFAGVDVRWRFRQFTEHVDLVAVASEADAILLTAESAAIRVPSWHWTPVDIAEGRPLSIDTFAVHASPTTPGVDAVVAASRKAGGPELML